MQALKRIARPEEIAGHRGNVILQDRQGRLDSAEMIEHAIHIEWRRVSDG
jgi:hypothetical protein